MAQLRQAQHARLSDLGRVARSSSRERGAREGEVDAGRARRDRLDRVGARGRGRRRELAQHAQRLALDVELGLLAAGCSSSTSASGSTKSVVPEREASCTMPRTLAARVGAHRAARSDRCARVK